MPGFVDRPPDFADTFRRLASRVGELERMTQAWANSPWQTPTLLNSFTNTGGANAPVAYYKDFVGRVYLRGRVTVPESTESGATIFMLDEGYRPVYTHEFPALPGSSFEGIPIYASIVVTAAGAVTLEHSLAEQVPLDVVQFRTV